MKTPKISVIIPCYNVEKYLKECLDSVLNQTFKDYEIICIEDCSTDNTKMILKEYAGKIQIVENEKNQGLAVSRNIGLSYANGEFIYFLDSDDTISEDCLKILYDRISEDKSDIAMSQIQAYPDNKQDSFCINQSKGLNDWLRFPVFGRKKIISKEAINSYQSLHCCAVNKLYKKSFLSDNTITFIHQKCFHEDNGFWLKVLSCEPTITGLEDITYFYRIRNNSISDKMENNKKEHNRHTIVSLEDARTFVKKRNIALDDFIAYEIYQLKKDRLFSFVWIGYEKHLKVFSFPVFRIKLNFKKGKYTLKILGVSVFKWRKK